MIEALMRGAGIGGAIIMAGLAMISWGRTRMSAEHQNFGTGSATIMRGCSAGLVFYLGFGVVALGVVVRIAEFIVYQR